MSVKSHSEGHEHGPLPRHQRKRRRASSDRGLPSDSDLARLATEYLTRQRHHWPDLVKKGLLPEVNDGTIAAMVEDFKTRHRAGEVKVEVIEPFRRFCLKLGGNYNRYSCDNSEPTSIIDQMYHALEKARAEGRFIPWAYIFCDYSVSGLSAVRQGYLSYKKVLADRLHFIETTYIDDFSRASRDEIEWWRLAYLSKSLGKRMIGASDGFDLAASDFEIKISLFGLLCRLFLKSLREKVKRGMGGASRRRTCVGKPSFGFTRIALRDENGNPQIGSDGKPKHGLCFDPETKQYRHLMYELFLEKGLTVHKITKFFNERRIDNWDGWTEAGIRKMLWNASSVGVFIWNRTRRERNPETGKVEVHLNPRKEWSVSYDPELRIIPFQWFAAARKKLAASKRGSRPKGTAVGERMARTLFHGVLVCGYCGKELILCRSTAKHKQMGCFNGPTGVHNCKLNTSKSVRIIEDCLLNFLRGQFLTEDNLADLVTQANTFLRQEAKRPRVDTAPLKKRLKEKEASIKRLFQRMEKSTDEALLQAYEKNISEMQKEVNHLRSELRQGEVSNVKPPRPLDKKRVMTYLEDLRGLLNQDIPAAAATIKTITGPIGIHQEPHTDGRTRGARWIARFSPDLLGILRQVAKDKDYPESITMEYLSTRFWITPSEVSVRIDKISPAVQKAAQIDAMAKKGSSIAAIAATLRLTPLTVRTLLKAYQTGEWPKWKKPGKRTGNGAKAVYKAIATEVYRLRTSELLSFQVIAKRLQVSRQTVARAFDFADPSIVSVAAETGSRPSRGTYRNSLNPVTEPSSRRLNSYKGCSAR